MSPLPLDLPDLPAATGARRVALHFLDQAAAAFPRLGDANDVEALHDFRVGLRRLRSAIRSYDAYLGKSLPRKRRRRLQQVARATGVKRDAEVHAAWIEANRASLTVDEQAGAAFLTHRLTSPPRGDHAARGDARIARFPKLRRRIARCLRRYTAAIDVEQSANTPTFAAATAALLHQLGAELREQLAAVRGIEDQATAHDARIAGKRLRYALDPFADSIEGVDAAIKQLKRLQDAFGELHDAHVFGEEIAAIVSTDATEPGAVDPRPGLVALMGRLHERRDAAFAAVGTWLSGQTRDDLLTAVGDIARRLTDRGAPSVEIERKYLLSALPDTAATVAPTEIEQGYLPGERLVERLRRVRAGDDERYFRTMKLGTGLRRIEVEEGTTREIFDALWPLTAGRRVHKRRHLVRDAGLTWEIDDFADRDLVLAEVELTENGVDSPVAVPAWLAPLVVRDVTGDPEFVNARLAR